MAGKRRVAPIHHEAGCTTFVLPRAQGDIRLVSRSAEPSALRPWLEDRRRLGVMIRQLVIHIGNERTVVAADDPRLTDGWWAVERDAATIWGWTDGNALLPLAGGPAVMEVAGSSPAEPIRHAPENKRCFLSQCQLL